MDDNSGSKIKIGVTVGGKPVGGNAGFHASFTALVLIFIGALLFLDNLGLLPFANVGAYWPLAISAYGVALLTRARNLSCMVWHLTMVAAGILLTLRNLGILHASTGALLWPIILIAAGVSMLVKRTPGCGPANWIFRWPNQIGASVKTGGDRTRNLDENAVFSSVNRRVDTANFERADLNCFFGELKVDLRAAGISRPDREAVVETNAAFGAIKLRVPETWKVVVSGSAVFGAYEDRTVPPRPAPGVNPPTLMVTGNAAFGSVEIEN
jgi:predicted membrane protein